MILPLTFLGGVFYSVEVLPSPWQEISHVNPIFFLVKAVRYGFLGTSDVSVALSLAVTAALAAAMVAWAPGCSGPGAGSSREAPGAGGARRPAASRSCSAARRRSSSARRSPRRCSTTSAPAGASLLRLGLRRADPGRAGPAARWRRHDARDLRLAALFGLSLGVDEPHASTRRSTASRSASR